MATPQGPVSPGPSFGTVITRPAGVMRHPLGSEDRTCRCDARLDPLERAVCATAAASSTRITVPRLSTVGTSPPSRWPSLNDSSTRAGESMAAGRDPDVTDGRSRPSDRPTSADRGRADKAQGTVYRPARAGSLGCRRSSRRSRVSAYQRSNRAADHPRSTTSIRYTSGLPTANSTSGRGFAGESVPQPFPSNAMRSSARWPARRCSLFRSQSAAILGSAAAAPCRTSARSAQRSSISRPLPRQDAEPPADVGLLAHLPHPRPLEDRHRGVVARRSRRRSGPRAAPACCRTSRRRSRATRPARGQRPRWW